MLPGRQSYLIGLMTNHVHLIIRAGGEKLLQDILRNYKKFTSKAIIQAIAGNIQESRKKWLQQHFKTPEGNRFWRSDNKQQRHRLQIFASGGI